MDPVELDEHINKQIGDFRRQLLGLTLRNPLLSCPHGQSIRSQIRIVDALHDAVFAHLDRGEAFEVVPLQAPRNVPDDEDDEEFTQALSGYKTGSLTYQAASRQLQQSRQGADFLGKLEREARDHVRLLLERGEWKPEQGLSPEDLALRRGIAPTFNLPSVDEGAEMERYQDDALQTLVHEQELASRLRLLRERTRSDLRDRGVNTLYAAFGFLEWYEDDAAQSPHLAPLVLVPVGLDRVSRDNRRVYEIREIGEEPVRNAALAEILQRHFDLELPDLDSDDTPESYFEKMAAIPGHKQRWRIRRFLTIQIFSDAKLAIHGDLDRNAWPNDAPLSQHRGVGQLMSETGVVDAPYAADHDIDGDEAATRLPTLIYDADSSQHSAIVDAMRDDNLTLYGPPGTGKSQTITNLIAAAMDAGKTVLFVAEKLTALDVVHKRLREAELDRYCFVLHSRGIRREAVREALRERVDAAPPSFDQAAYGDLRKDWETQRDALKLYASVMGDRLGALRLTVHDTLWQEIRRRERGESLPPAVASIRLPDADALALTANDLQRTNEKIRDLVSARRALGEAGPQPWRGIHGQELPPTELDPTLHRLTIWRDAAVDVVDKVARFSGVVVPITLEAVTQVTRVMVLLADNTELMRNYDLEVLGLDATRRAVIDANDAATTASRHAGTLRETYELDPVRLPSLDDIRMISSKAVALHYEQRTASELAGVAGEDRRQADTIVRVRSVLENLYRLFNVLESETGAVQTVVQATELIRETSRALLLARTEDWAEEDAHTRLSTLQASIEDVHREREALARRFNVKTLPPAAELRKAGLRLEKSSRLWRLSGASRRAARLHKGITAEPIKTKARAKAVDLLRLAEHADSVALLKADEDGKALLGTAWEGEDTDLGEALEVTGWTAAVAGDFSGDETGRAAIRDTLLHSAIETLDEVVNIADGLEEIRVEDYVGADGVPIADPDELYRRAGETDELAARYRQAGLPQDLPLSRVNEVVDLIDRYHEACQAASDVKVPRLDGDVIADDDSIGALAALCQAIEEEAVSREAWHTAIKAIAEHGPPVAGEWIENVGGAVDDEDHAWQAWTDPLQVEESAFFDGVQRNAAPLDAVRGRAEECLSGGEAILEWCRYLRLRDEIFHGVARPVLESLEKTGIEIGHLSFAFELALHRSLASIVFRDHPQLQQVTGEQLHNHKQAFHDIEKKLQKLECSRIAHELHHRPVEHGESVGPPGILTERALINHQLGLRRASVSPRELVRRSGKALLQLKPCFMMSPTTVAELLPKKAELFDLVVIDEASQMLPADALGAVARAKNAIIVGDPRQLPPTTFFRGAQPAAEDDDDDGIAGASESILDLAMSAWRPHRYLRWHYRSHHSGLIQFSNAKFYDDRMIVFPSPNEDASDGGVNFRYVEKGIYRGDRTNELEVRYVVDAVLRFVTNRNNWERSLAIVTMNQPQRDLLDEVLDRVASEHASLSGYIRRWENTLEPFTVKNLESVQGDERDVIFISTVYGPQTPGGPVLQTFGPITQQGGDRRLNVLFTRARWRIDVFASMRANDIQRRPGQSRGVEVLRDYLEYAATGHIEGGTLAGTPTESPFEQHVKERLEAAGYDVTPQVGVAGYRIDLGVKHADYPHGYLLGIECDGATYHSAKSVRDRDRLREAVLRDLGWEIYRIWSTDWCRDPAHELQRLLGCLNERLRKFNERQEAEDLDLAGAVVGPDGLMEDAPDVQESIAVAAPGAGPDEPVREAEVVEVGDTVVYRRNVKGSESRKVVIVGGADDPERGVINDAKPLARAMLGRSRGETVTVRQPNTRVEVVIEQIVKSEPDAGEEAPRPRQPGSYFSDGGLSPYRVWRGTVRDPRNMATTELADALREIIAAEGPILTERVYRAYTRASGLRRAGRQIRKVLDRALADLDRRKIVTIAGQEGDNGYAGATIRLAGSPEIVPRDRGDRDFNEIPINELAQVYRLIRSESRADDEDSICREVLARYGMVRLTANVRDRLNEAAQRLNHAP